MLKCYEIHKGPKPSTGLYRERLWYVNICFISTVHNTKEHKNENHREQFVITRKCNIGQKTTSYPKEP